MPRSQGTPGPRLILTAINYNSFAAVSRKLGELERPRRNARRWLFQALLVLVAALSISTLIPYAQF